MIETHTYDVAFGRLELQVSAKVKSQGPEWLLCLHGIQSNKDLFEEFLCQPFMSPFSFLSLDFIGFGQSSKPKDFSYDIQDQATIVQKVRQK